MAINKNAKNLTVKIKNNYTSMSQTIYETAERVEIIATKENLTLNSNKKVQLKGNKS
jgi:hypothetical protein